MNKSVENDPIQKFLLYSGHDTTCKYTVVSAPNKSISAPLSLAVVPILVALQVDTMEWPPYASMMLLELYDQGGEMYVRIVYNGNVLPLKFCGSKTLCDFKTFSGYMKSVTPSDPALQCQVSV